MGSKIDRIASVHLLGRNDIKFMKNEKDIKHEQN